MHKMLVRITRIAILGVVVAAPIPALSSHNEAPSETPELSFVTKDEIEWTRPDDAFRFDLVRGDLNTLLETQGDFAQATTVCLDDDSFQTDFEDQDEPGQGQGFWYVVRGGNRDGDGTYNSLSASQQGDRDSINASPFSCPASSRDDRH